MKRFLLFVASHLAVFTLGFGLGIYLLPIISAPPAPDAAQVRAAAQGARWQGEFRRDVKGSDALHWGEGRVSVGPGAVALAGRVSPGPAYRLYLVPRFVDTREGFLQVKAQSLAVGDIRTFENFIVPLPPNTRLEDYDTVLVWCEAFSAFITAARDR